MLNSTPYINPAMIGGADIRSGTGPEAGVRPPTPGTASGQNRDARSAENNAPDPLFPAAGDRVELSPAARRLAEQNPATSSSAAEQAQAQNSSAAGKDGNAPATDKPTASNVNNESAPGSSGTESSATNENEEQSAPDNASSRAASGVKGENMPPKEQQEVQELKQRDQEVRTHEAAHASMGGQYAGAPTLEYETGPDGRRYAVSGEVSIDLSKAKGAPQETIDKMEQVQVAAMAPAQPSAQDRRVAARAAQIAAQARMDLRMEQSGATIARAATPAGTSSPQSDGNENAQQPPRVSTPGVSIESLRWAGAVA